MESVIREFFILDENGWNNRRCDSEIQRFREKSQKARQSAKIGSERRANAVPSLSERTAIAVRPLSERTANGQLPSPQSPVPIHQTPELREREGARAEFQSEINPEEDREPTQEELFALLASFRHEHLDGQGNTVRDPLTEADRKAIRGWYFNRGPRQTRDAIKLLGDNGWHITPAQIQRVFSGEITPETFARQASKGRSATAKRPADYHTSTEIPAL